MSFCIALLLHGQQMLPQREHLQQGHDGAAQRDDTNNRLHLPLVLFVGLCGGIFELLEAFFGTNNLVGLRKNVTGGGSKGSAAATRA